MQTKKVKGSLPQGSPVVLKSVDQHTGSYQEPPSTDQEDKVLLQAKNNVPIGLYQKPQDNFKVKNHHRNEKYLRNMITGARNNGPTESRTTRNFPGFPTVLAY